VVDAETFEVGDYATIYPYCFFPGPGSIRIGHNFWLGYGSIVDCMGGTVIGDNVGIGPQSQLWTHMIYGDVLAGCRFHTNEPLTIGSDVWFVGHCLVSPITAGDRSLAMLGSLITRDMAADHCYAGAPAIDVTDKFGPQFEPRPVEERVRWLEQKLDEFGAARGARTTRNFAVVTTPDELRATDPTVTAFNVADRTYTKRGTGLEYELIRFLLPDAKFVPLGD